MQCPVCAEQLVIVEYEGVELDLCAFGHGVWFDDQELHMLLESTETAGAARSIEQSFRPVEAPAGEAKKPCPRCGAKMDHVEAPADPKPVVLDRCPHGHGLWFDEGELRSVLEKHATGEDSALGRVFAHLTAFETGGADNGDTEEKLK